MLGTKVLKNLNYRHLWLGQAISQLGDALYFLVFLFVAQELTNSEGTVGIVSMLNTLPFLLFLPLAGVYADRHDRKGIMLFCDLASVAVLVGIAVVAFAFRSLPIALIMVAAFALSTVNAFFMPAKSAAIPNLVTKEELMEATSLSMATQSLMPLIGIAFSALILGNLASWFDLRGDEALVFFFVAAVILNAATFAFSAYHIRKLPSIVPERNEADAHAGTMAQAKEGFLFIKNQPILLVIFMVSFALNVFTAPFMIVYVVANDKWFGGSYGTFALIEASFMVALLIGSVLCGRIRFTRLAWLTFVCFGGTGLGIVLMAYAKMPLLFIALNIACGLIIPFANIPIQTYVQLVVPDEVRGRVSAAFSLAQIGVQPLIMGVSGFLLKQVGLEAMFWIIGMGMFVVSLASLFHREFLHAKMPELGCDAPPDEESATENPVSLGETC